ncbi:MAG: hypothetical protein WCF25_13025 [Acidimicrobiales bacterium]
MDSPEHFVRREEPPPPLRQPWWRRALRQFNRFMFHHEPGYIPPYHGNMQGATINDPRFTPGLFNSERVDFSNPEADRHLDDETK